MTFVKKEGASEYPDTPYINIDRTSYYPTTTLALSTNKGS